MNDTLDPHQPLDEVRKTFHVDWYRGPIDRTELMALLERSDLRGWCLAAGHLVLFACTGALALFGDRSGSRHGAFDPTRPHQPTRVHSKCAALLRRHADALRIAQRRAYFRLCVRSITLNPISEFLYLHMNWHTEHHMFAAVRCYHLPRYARGVAPPADRT